MHHYLSWKLLNVWSLTTDNEGNTGKVCHLWLSLVFVFAESSSLTCVQVAVSREGLSALVHFPHILLSTEPKIENRPCQDGATAVGKKLPTAAPCTDRPQAVFRTGLLPATPKPAQLHSLGIIFFNSYIFVGT